MGEYLLTPLLGSFGSVFELPGDAGAAASAAGAGAGSDAGAGHDSGAAPPSFPSGAAVSACTLLWVVRACVYVRRCADARVRLAALLLKQRPSGRVPRAVPDPARHAVQEELGLAHGPGPARRILASCSSS